jgi:hypothetical protein
MSDDKTTTHEKAAEEQSKPATMSEAEPVTTGRKRKQKYLTRKQTVFAQGVAAGASPTQAFQAAYGRKNTAEAAKNARIPHIEAEIERMREVNRNLSTLERKDLINYLTAILFTPVAWVDAEHLLAESYEAYRDGAKERVKVKMVSKMEAMKTLCRMMGWWEADKPQEDNKTVFYIKKMWEDGEPKLVEGQELNH